MIQSEIMSKIEEKGKEAFHQFWSDWSSRTRDVDDIIMQMADEEFMGFGTNWTEFWKDRDELKEQMIKERSQIEHPYIFEVHWTETKAISENILLVCGEIDVTLQIGKKNVVLDRVRNTLVLREESGGFKVHHWHCSVPDAGSSGEVVPGALQPRRYDEASVLFCDFVGFTNIVASIPPIKLVDELSDLYQHFDDIMEELGVERIQTTGDGYLAVCKLHDEAQNHAIRCVKAGKKILEYLALRDMESAIKWEARIGIHSGPITAGVVGKKKFTLNIFGDTVNVAARLEGTSEKGRINISAYTYDLIKDEFACEYRGKIDAKGKGPLDMYFVK